MTEMNPAQSIDNLSPDEQELKSLLDKVLVASTMQPLREDLSKAMPAIEEAVTQSVASAQKRLIHHVSSSQDQLAERLEAEMEALRRRLSDEVEDAAEKLSQGFAQARSEITQSEASNKSSFETLSSTLERLELSNKEYLRQEISSSLQLASKKIQEEQQKVTQLALRWQEDNEARSNAQMLELKALREQVGKSNRASRALQWSLFVLMLVYVLTWAFTTFGL